MTARAWKYKTETVTVGENSQGVRAMTAGERKQFGETSQKIKKGELQAGDLPLLVAGWACDNPKLTADDVTAMPPDLLDGCVSKIMELSGFSKDATETDTADPEKKA